MKKTTSLFLLFALSVFWQANAQISPIEVSGFTEDIIANGIGAMSTSTTMAADADSFCLLSEDWQLNASDPPITVGLPANGIITSTGIPGLTYQIPPTATPYAGNNSLRIDQSGAANAGTISLVTPDRYAELYLLVFSGNGASDMDITIHFSDATTESFPTNIIPDWYQTGLPVEISGFGRGDISNNNVETPTGNPKLFRLQISISLINQAKDITSITFTRNNPTIDDTVFNLVAVSGMLVDFCVPPSAVQISNIGTTQADVLWSSNGTATEWEIEYGPTGFPSGSGTSITDNDGTIGETITGLSPATNYEVYVRSVCGVGDESTWTGPQPFSTACAVVSTFPFSVSFEDTSPNRVCWSMEYVSGTENWMYVSTNQNGSITPRTGSLMAEFKKANPSGEVTKLVSPALDLTSLSSPQLIFYYANVGWQGDIDELRVYYKTSATDTWTQIGNDYTNEHTSWTQISLQLPNPSSEYYIAFEGTANFGRGVNIDDVWVGQNTAACAPPTNLMTVTIGNDSAEFSWNAVSNASNGYECYVFVAGDDPNTATPIVTKTVAAGTTSALLTGLSPETAYDFYVISNCGTTDGMSTLAGPLNFTTTNMGIADEVFESFSYYPNPVMNTLTLKATHEIQQVSVYDLLGQKVMEIQPHSLTPPLNLSELQTGTYLMQVTIGDSVRIFTIIME